MSQPPKDKPQEESPDDFELRPLQRMHGEHEDDTVAEVPEAERRKSAPAPVPEGMVACASCLQVKPQAEVTLMPDGRLLCPTCVTAHKRRNAREESRIEAAAKSAAWFNVGDGTAWTLAVAVPVAAWLALLAVMTMVRHITTMKTPSALHDASVLIAVILIETVLVLVSLAISALIFSGLDLPSMPNRLWKIMALLTVDMLVFVWTCTLWTSSPCMTIGYFVAVRPIFLGIGLIVLLGLETLEGAITVMIAWAAVCAALLSTFARSVLLPGASF
jgi:hypothetical protein